MRLTDDEIRTMRSDLWDRSTGPNLSHVERLLDEIEERRRIDARRLADAEQAFREELER